MKRILFVDDDPGILDGIRRMLHADRDRWEMEFVLGGEAALQACEKNSFDIVVSDMRMPSMDGATFLAHMRDRHPATARIVLSGHCAVEAATRVIPVAHRFLAKPCSSKDLQGAIEGVCVLQELLARPELCRVVGSIGQLPALSSTYTALSKAVMNSETPLGKIAEIIEKDMAVSAKVLQLVNSAFFGLAQRVTTLRSAVGYLGMDTIKNLVLVTETVQVFVPDKRIPPSAHQHLQAHAQRVAGIVARLPLDPRLRDVTILAALLHNIGRLIFASRLPDQFCATLALANQLGCPIHEAEEQLLGISHAEAGAYLLGLWGIPHIAVEAIAHYLHPTRVPHSTFDSSVALYVANLLASAPLNGNGSPTSALDESHRRCLEELGILNRLPEFRELALRGGAVDT